MHEIIDVAWNVGNYAERLAEAGVKTVIRYYNHRNSERLPSKALSLRERDQLFGAGLSIAVVFQQRGGQAAISLTCLPLPVGETSRALCSWPQPWGSPRGPRSILASTMITSEAPSWGKFRPIFKPCGRVSGAGT